MERAVEAAPDRDCIADQDRQRDRQQPVLARRARSGDRSEVDHEHDGRAAQQKRHSDAARGHPHELAVGRLRRLLVCALGQCEQPGAQRIRLRDRQIGETRGAAGATHAQPQFGEPERAGQAGPHGVDRLHLRERVAQRASAQQSGLDPQVGPVDLPARDEPRDDSEDDQRSDRDDMPGDIPAVRPAGDERRQEDDPDRDQRAPRAHRRRQRVQAMPAAHSPAALASPSAGELVAQTRRLGGLESGDARVTRSGRRVQSHRGETERTLDRACGHVDELHASVRHDGETSDHQPAPHQQVVLPLQVAPRADPALEQHVEHSPGERAPRLRRQPRRARLHSVRGARRSRPSAAAVGTSAST